MITLSLLSIYLTRSGSSFSMSLPSKGERIETNYHRIPLNLLTVSLPPLLWVCPYRGSESRSEKGGFSFLIHKNSPAFSNFGEGFFISSSSCLSSSLDSLLPFTILGSSVNSISCMAHILFAQLRPYQLAVRFLWIRNLACCDTLFRMQ